MYSNVILTYNFWQPLSVTISDSYQTLTAVKKEEGEEEAYNVSAMYIKKLATLINFFSLSFL